MHTPLNDVIRKRFFLYVIFLGTVVRLLLVLSVPENYTSPEARQNYLVRSQAVLEGKLPYRDFWDSKPPLWTYTFAFWGKFFGIHVFSLKLLVIISEMLFIWLLFRFAVFLLHDEKLALSIALLYTFLPQVLFVGAVEGKYESLTFIFCIGALWLLLKNRLWLAAIVIGCGMAYKYSVALILLPSILYLAIKRMHTWRQIGLFALTPFAVLALILSPFLILSPDTFLLYTVKNFISAQQIPERIAGLYNDTPGYHAISLWGALRYGLGIVVPTFLPFLAQISLVVCLSVIFIRKKQSPTEFIAIYYGYNLITAILLFLQLGHLQYFNWSVPFMAIIFWHIWQHKAAIQGANRILGLFIFHSLLLPYTSKNWFAPVSGSILVILSLVLTAYLLYMVTKLALNERLYA